MLRWYPHLYVGERARKEQGQLVRDIEELKGSSGAYVLTFPVNEANQLELVPVRILRQQKVLDRTPMIVGLAADKAEALEMVEALAKESLLSRGDTDLKAYLRGRLAQ